MAYGACVQAAVLGRKPGVPSIYVRNVTPLTIGLLSANKNMQCHPIIKRNTAYPTEEIVEGRTSRSNQTRVRITLFEGEKRLIGENVIMGSMVLNGITASLKGQEIVDISIKIDDKGTISASAIDRKTRKRSEIKIEKAVQFCKNQTILLKNMLDELPKAIETEEKIPKDADDFDIMNSINSKLASTKRKKIEKNVNENDEVCPVYGDVNNELEPGHVELVDISD